MRFVDVLDYCLAKPGAWQDEPWDGDIVAKVDQKVFAFLGSPGPDGSAGGIGLKCGEYATEASGWRDRYPDAVTVGLCRSVWVELLLPQRDDPHGGGV